MATDNFGGHMSVKLSDGTPIVMRAEGDFTIEGTTLSAEAVTNQNGTIDRTLAPKPAKMMCDFKDNNLPVQALMEKTGLNLTVVERVSGVTHLFTDGFFTGTPAANRKTGTITGLVFEAARYRRLS